MRFLIKVILAMVLFNAILIIFAGYFKGGTLQENANTEYTNSSSGYAQSSNPLSLISKILNPLENWEGSAIFLSLCAVGVLGGILAGQSIPLYLGSSVLIGVFAYFFTGSLKVFTHITNNGTVTMLITMMTFIICILFVISFGQMLSGRADI